MFQTPSLRLPTHTLPAKTSWLKEKKSHRLSGFKTLAGASLPEFDLGYETYGKLNSSRDNVILICHYFSGSSNAAGRYSPQDLEPGYWDELIGPQKSIDTDHFFVVAVDILVNACPALPLVKTVGPATLNPETGAAFGMSFPKITVADMVRSQKVILDALGVTHLQAVVGGSLGSMQAWQWAVDYPDFVSRIVPVIGSGFETHPFVINAVDLWARLLKADPDWRQRESDNKSFPQKGMVSALEMLTWNCLSAHWCEIYGAQAAATLAQQRAQFIDPHHFLYIIDAVQSFGVRDKLEKIKARALVVAAESDFLMLPEFSKQAVLECQQKGLKATYAEIKGQGGHLDGLFEIAQVGPEIKKFILS